MSNVRIKIYVTIIAMVLTTAVISLFIIDNSKEWNIDKICTCFFVSLWVFFIPQMFTYYLIKMKNSELGYSISLGYDIGAKGFLGCILAPYYGVKFYLVDLNELKYHGEFFL